MSEPRPVLSFVLTLVAGVLVLVNGVLLLIAGSIANSLGYATASSLLSGIGALGFGIGFLLMILAGVLWIIPESHLVLGILIIVFSVISLFGGGGFLIGILLGVLGGIFAIVFETTEEEAELGYLPTVLAATPPAPATCWNCGRAWDAGSATCPACGAFPRSTSSRF
ncbi:MAG TPA: zinc ribbon domain-containing protein [Thermoplasmata archaeon]|nr:zinc ribbon domain-containing protein [Thermoplasmata archaeon]